MIILQRPFGSVTFHSVDFWFFFYLTQEYEADSLDYTEPEQKHEIEDHPSLGKGFYLRRRYAVSAAPMTEEDATSYVKKVIFFDLHAFVDEKNTSNLKLVLAFFRWYLKTTRLRLPFRRLLPRTSCFLTWTKEKGGQYETFIALYHMIHLNIRRKACVSLQVFVFQ